MKKMKYVCFLILVTLFLTSCPNAAAPSDSSSGTEDNTFTISYNDNGSDSGTIPISQTKDKGSDITLAINSGNLLRDGYEFDGWNTKSDGTGTDYAAGATYANDANVTLYAKWYDVAFITEWYITGTDLTIRIPTHTNFTYDFDVDWGDGSSDSNVTSSKSHTYSESYKIYTVKITGVFPKISFNYLTAYDSDDLLRVTHWGNNQWESMNSAFSGCINLKITATDAPDLSQVTDMSSMFKDISGFQEGTLDSWDVSNVTNMSYIFSDVSSFNEDINSWDLSNVTSMNGMFRYTSFNQDISLWDVSNVSEFMNMFEGTTSFINHDLSSWDVDYTDDARTHVVHNYFTSNWGTGNTEPNWID